MKKPLNYSQFEKILFWITGFGLLVLGTIMFLISLIGITSGVAFGFLFMLLSITVIALGYHTCKRNYTACLIGLPFLALALCSLIARILAILADAEKYGIIWEDIRFEYTLIPPVLGFFADVILICLRIFRKRSR